MKGATCYKDIKIVNDIVYNTFKKACYVLGLLDDDVEYIAALKEAVSWGTSKSLRKLFSTMLFCNYLLGPNIVWKDT